VTIPQALRDLIGLRPGDRFAIEDLPEGVLLRKLADDVKPSTDDLSSPVNGK